MEKGVVSVLYSSFRFQRLEINRPGCFIVRMWSVWLLSEEDLSPSGNYLAFITGLFHCLEQGNRGDVERGMGGKLRCWYFSLRMNDILWFMRKIMSLFFRNERNP